MLDIADQGFHRDKLIVQLVVDVRAIDLNDERRILHARVVPEKQFNRLVGATRNKSNALFSTSAIHLDHLLRNYADKELVIFCDRQGGRSHYGYLLEAGAKIYEVQNEVLHSKTASIDGVWTAVGSSNFDPRSVVFNDEVDAIVLGSATADDFERMFQKDLARARVIDRETWRRRPLSQRLLELVELTSFLWRNWL